MSNTEVNTAKHDLKSAINRIFYEVENPKINFAKQQIQHAKTYELVEIVLELIREKKIPKTHLKEIKEHVERLKKIIKNKKIQQKIEKVELLFELSEIQQYYNITLKLPTELIYSEKDLEELAEIKAKLPKNEFKRRIMNLIDNAHKYGEGKVKIQFRKNKNHAIIEVESKGAIPERELKKIHNAIDKGIKYTTRGEGQGTLDVTKFANKYCEQHHTTKRRYNIFTTSNKTIHQLKFKIHRR